MKGPSPAVRLFLNTNLWLGVGYGFLMGFVLSSALEWVADGMPRGDFWVAFWTAGLLIVALLQAALFLWQLSYMRSSLRDTARAANAAAEQASIAGETFQKLERPYLYVTGVRNFEIHTSVGSGIDPFVRYTVANHGKIAAKIRAVYVGNCSVTDAAPTSALLTDLTNDLMANRVFGPGEVRDGLKDYACIGVEWYFPTSWNYPKTPGAVPQLAPTEEYFFYIKIEYDGPFTKSHVTTACWRWDDGEGAFVEFNDPAFNVVV